MEKFLWKCMYAALGISLLSMGLAVLAMAIALLRSVF